MKKNNTIEEINTSINNLLEEWNISKEHNDKVVTHIIGLQLKKIRLVNKMTQTRVAKSIFVTFQQIQKYEKGQNLINPINLLALTDYFNVSFDYWVKPIQNKNLTLLTKRRENGYSQVREWTHDRV
jgi:transcriptional regulator with XRE-family HTH domain|nr:transcriptional regulator [uncultured Mediterranean phage uvMED]BAR28178.1 transcriptional regulator [uncultured Mediterranean phage uvMED]